MFAHLVLPDLHPGDPEPAEIQQAKASNRDLDNGSTFLFATATAQKSAKRLVAKTADAASADQPCGLTAHAGRARHATSEQDTIDRRRRAAGGRARTQAPPEPR